MMTWIHGEYARPDERDFSPAAARGPCLPRAAPRRCAREAEACRCGTLEAVQEPRALENPAIAPGASYVSYRGRARMRNTPRCLYLDSQVR